MPKEIFFKCEGPNVTIETKGYVGKACQDATSQFEKALGIVKSDTKTPEFHTREVRTVGN